MNVWDSRLPTSVEGVINLLERRIEVHKAWRARLLAKEEKALKAADYGVGTVDSHETYANQYRAAIEVLRDALQPAKEPTCPQCGGDGYLVQELTRPTCCGNVLPSGECRGDCAVPEYYQEQVPCEACRTKESTPTEDVGR